MVISVPPTRSRLVLGGSGHGSPLDAIGGDDQIDATELPDRLALAAGVRTKGEATVHSFEPRRQRMTGDSRTSRMPIASRLRPLVNLGLAALVGVGSTVAWGAWTTARAGAADGQCSMDNIGPGANCSYAHLSEVNLSNRDLQGVNFLRADLSFTDFHGADLANADLSHANLTGTNLSGANLTDAKLPNVNGERASFVSAKLSGANFYQATLTGSRGGADFSGAHLHGSNFDRANATGANFSKAHLQGSGLAIDDNVLTCQTVLKTGNTISRNC